MLRLLMYVHVYIYFAIANIVNKALRFTFYSIKLKPNQVFSKQFYFFLFYKHKIFWQHIIYFYNFTCLKRSVFLL